MLLFSSTLAQASDLHPEIPEAEPSTAATGSDSQSGEYPTAPLDAEGAVNNALGPQVTEPLTIGCVVSPYDSESGLVTITLTAEGGVGGPITILNAQNAPLTVEEQAGVYTATDTVSKNGSYLYTATDGNETETCTAVVSNIPDTTPPAPPDATLIGEAQNGYYKGSCTVTATVNQDDGTVVSLYYILDSGAEEHYTGALTISEHGQHTLVLIARDEAGNEASATHTILVRAPWPPIQIISGGDNLALLQGGTLTLTLDVSAVGGASVSAACAATGVSAQLSPLAGDQYSLAVAADGTAAPGGATVTVTALLDGETFQEDIVIAISEAGAPTAPTLGTQNIKFDETLSIDIGAVSSDPQGYALSYVIQTPPVNGNASISAAGELTCTPDTNARDESVTIRISNGVKHTDITVAIRIYAAPVLSAGPHELQTNEDTPLALNLADYATDPYGRELRYAVLQQPQHGTLSLSGSALEYTPGADYFGGDSFSVKVENDLYEDTLVFNMTVAPVEDAPTAVDDTATVDSNGEVWVDVLQNDVVIDTGAVPVLDSIGALPAKALTCRIEQKDGKQQIYYKPNPLASGTDTFTYLVKHGESGGLTAVGTVTVTINQVNDPHIITLDAGDTPVEINEDEQLSFSFVVTDIDSADIATAFDVAVTSANTQVFDDSASGFYGITSEVLSPTQIRYTVTCRPVLYANTAEHGAASFAISVSETPDPGLTASAQQHVTVSPVNNTPTLHAIADGVTDEDVPYSATLVITDPDLSALAGTDPLARYRFEFASSEPSVIAPADCAVTLPERVGGEDRQAQFTLTVSPKKDQNSAGGVLITVTVYEVDGGDKLADTQTFTLVVTPVNDPPTVKNDSATMNEDETKILDVLANDSDPDGHDDFVIIAVTGNLPGSTLNIIENGRKLEYTPPLNYYGPEQFTYTIRDGGGVEKTATVTLTIKSLNDAPTFGGLPADRQYQTNEDTPLKIVVDVDDVETDNAALFLQASVLSETPAGLTGSVYVDEIGAEGTTTDQRVIWYKPALNQNGTAHIRLTLTDTDDPATVDITVTVAPVNDSPVAKDDKFDFHEDQPLIISVAKLLENDSDVDSKTNGDMIRFVWSPDATNYAPAHGTLTPEYDAGSNLVSLRYTPSPNSEQNDEFQYIIEDSQGAQAYAVVKLTCIPENDPPVLAPISDKSMLEDDPAAPLVVSLDFSDPETTDNQDLTVTVKSRNTGLVNSTGLMVDKALGTLAITPIQDKNGVTTITVTVSDGNRAAEQEFELTVTAVPDAPVAVDDVYDAVAGRPLSFNLLDNDYDVDSGDTGGDYITPVSITEVQNPIGATLSMSADGVVSFFAPTGSVGTCTFTYEIKDKYSLTATGTLTVNVSAYGVGPMILPQNAVITTADAGGVVTLTLEIRNVPANGEYTLTAVCDDAASLPGANLSIAGAGNSVSGLKGQSQTLKITPRLDIYYSSMIKVRLSYGGQEDEITIPITVTRDNSPPEVDDITVTLAEGQSMDFMVMDGVRDVQQPLNVSILRISQQPAGGHVYIRTDGSGKQYINYTAPTHYGLHYYSGDATFKYLVVDGGGLTAEGTVNIAVTPEPTIPYPFGEYFMIDGHNSGDPLTVGNAVKADNPILRNDRDFDTYNGITDEEPTMQIVPYPNAGDPTSFTDPSGAAHAYSLSADGKFITFTPTVEGWYTLRYKVKTLRSGTVDTWDTSGRDVSAYIGVTFSGLLPPRISGDTYENSEDCGEITRDIDGLIHVTNRAGTAVELATGPVVTDSDGVMEYVRIEKVSGKFHLTYKPKPNMHGKVSLTWSVKQSPDGVNSFQESNVGTINLTIHSINDAPEIKTIPDQLTNVFRGDDCTLEVKISDVDHTHDQLKATVVSSDNKIIPSEAITLVKKAGDNDLYLLTFKPENNYPDYENSPITITVTATDGALQDEKSFTVIVRPKNRAPVARALQEETITEDGQGEFNAASWGSDEDGDALKIVFDHTLDAETGIFYGGAHVTDKGDVIVDNDKKILYSPPKDYFTPAGESVEIRYKLSDGHLTSGVGVIRVTITPENDAPEIYGLAQDYVYTMQEDVVTDFTFMVRDVDLAGGEEISFDFSHDSTYITSVATTMAEDASGGFFTVTMKITPAEDANHASGDSTTITIRARDENNGVGEHLFKLAITPVNDAVRLRNSGDDPCVITIREDEPESIDIVSLYYDPDDVGLPDSQKGQIIILDLPTVVNGSVDNIGHKAHFVPEKDYFSSDYGIASPTDYASFTYRVSDLHGGAASGTVIVIVEPVNDDPVVPDLSRSMDEDGTLDILPFSDLLNPVKDVDNDLDTLFISDVTTPLNGTAEIVQRVVGGKELGRELRYKPNADYHGADQFFYTISDPSGGSATGKITVTIRSVLDPPRLAFELANDPDWAQHEVPEGQITQWTMLEDIDTAFKIRVWQPEEAKNPLLSISVFNEDKTTAHTAIVPRERMSLQYADGMYSLTLRPLANQFGSFYIKFEASEGGNVVTRWVHVTVQPVNDLPVVSGDTCAIDEDGEISDLISATDVETPAADLKFRVSSAAEDGAKALVSANGMVTVARATGANWRWAYTPNPNFYGTDSFRLAVDDEDGGTSYAEFVITVRSVNDPPTPPTDLALDSSWYKDGETATLTFVAGTDIEGSAHYAETPRSELAYRLEYTVDGTNWIALATSFHDTPDAQFGLSYSFPVPAGQNTSLFQLRAHTIDKAVDGAAATTSTWAYSPKYVLDNTPPTATSTLTPSGAANTDVIIRLTVTDPQPGASGVQSVAPPGSATAEGSGANWHDFRVTTNGTYTFTLTDKVGNTSTVDVVVSNIDRLSPSVAADLESLDAAADKYADSGAVVNLTFTDAAASGGSGKSGLSQCRYALVPRGQTPTAADWKTVTISDPLAAVTATVNLNRKGSWSLHAEVTDKAGNSASRIFGTYEILNRPPVAQSGQIAVTELAGSYDEIDFATLVSDVDGAAALTIAVGNLSSGEYGSWVKRSGNTWRFTHNGKGNPFVDTLTVPFTVTDDDGESASATLTVNVTQVNDPPTAPVVTGPASGSAFRNGDSVALTWTAGSDEETAQADLVYVIQVNYTGAAGEANWADVATSGPGDSGYTHIISSTANSAAMQFRIRAVDEALEAGAIAAERSVWAYSPKYILDNTPPGFQVSAKSQGSPYALESEANYPINITFSYTDTGSGLLQYKYYVSGSATPPASGDYLDTPTATGHTVTVSGIGEYYLHLYAVDRVGNESLLSQGRYRIVNTPPQAVSDAVSVEEGGSVIIELTGEDDDYQDEITAWTPDPSSLTYGTLDPVIEDGVTSPNKYLYTHDGVDPVQDDTLAFTVTDTHGASASGAITIHVISVNDTPYFIGLNPSYTTPEDTPLSIPFQIHDDDIADTPDQLKLTISSSDQTVIPHGGLSAVVAGDGTATLTVTPAKDRYTEPGAPVTLTFTVTDPWRASSTLTVEVEVTPVNDPPTARDQYLTVLPGGKVSGTVFAEDVENDALTFTVEAGGQDHGTLIPAADFAASGKFTYETGGTFDNNTQDYAVVSVTDAAGAAVSIRLYFLAGVIAEEDCGPVESMMVNAPGVPPHTSFRITSTNHALAPPEACSVSIDGPDGEIMSLTITPRPDQYGNATVTVSFLSGNIVVAEYAIPVVITALNDPPRVAGMRLTAIPQNGQTASGKLEPDDSADGLYETSGFHFSIGVADGPQHGVVDLMSDGSFTYTPDEDYLGEDFFYVTVTELTNDPLENPAPFQLPDNISAGVDDCLSVRVLVQVSVETPRSAPPSKSGSGGYDGRDRDGPPPRPQTSSPEPDLPTGAPEVGSGTQGTHSVEPQPAPSPQPRPDNGEVFANKSPDDSVQAVTSPESDASPPEVDPPSAQTGLPTSPGTAALPWPALGACSAAVIFLLLIFSSRITVTAQVEGEQSGKRTFYCRKVRRKKGALLLDLSHVRIEQLPQAGLCVRFGWIYRRRFYGRAITFLYHGRQVGTRIPPKDVYRKNGVQLNGSDFRL